MFRSGWGAVPLALSVLSCADCDDGGMCTSSQLVELRKDRSVDFEWIQITVADQSATCALAESQRKALCTQPWVQIQMNEDKVVLQLSLLADQLLITWSGDDVHGSALLDAEQFQSISPPEDCGLRCTISTASIHVTKEFGK